MFEFESYHVLLATAGFAIIVSYWSPRFISGREPAASALLVLTGFAGFSWVPGMPAALNPVETPRIWEVAAELCVILSLFGTGLRVDRLVGRNLWTPTLRLLVIAMPLTIIALAIIGWQAAGMTLAGALLLGAVLSPTDPVLAGEIQVGRPSQGGEHPVRFALTTEAGLNDGLAFPFVHLGIVIATAGTITADLITEWAMRDLVYRVLVGAVGGAATGWLLGKVLFVLPKGNALAMTQTGVVAFAGVIFAYGLTELIEGYGFIAAFVAGLALRRQETESEFHQRLHDFSESLEHTLTALILVALGAALSSLWPYLGWPEFAIGLSLVFVIRPLAGWLALTGLGLSWRPRAVISFYGVRGIGSVYYLAYAGHHVELVNEGALWVIVAFTIVLSTSIHGLTAGFVVERVTRSES
ncbi:MAG: sodium/proton antiporter, CPA1 family [Porphyrobacter sp. HL-46]|nr:MAG: sodium/proton antiporter, CPA1 family [Porphyrobacter sp. HL-46]